MTATVQVRTSAGVLLATVMLGFVAGIPASAQPVTIEVSPSAREPARDLTAAPAAAPGSKLGPVRTLAAAVAMALDIRRAQPATADIAIELAPGLHRLEAPVRIGPEHGGLPGKPLVIRGSSVGEAILRGSIVIAPEPGDASGYNRIGEKARAQARVYKLPARLASVRHIDTARPHSLPVLVERLTPITKPSVPFEVFDGDGAMRPARWPNTGWGKVEGPAGDGWWSFATDAPRLNAWRTEPDLWTAGYWKHDYTYERHFVRSVGPRTLTLGTPFVFGLKTGARFHVYHALAELDEPGEWYRDTLTNRLVAWIRSDAAGPASKPGTIEVSIAESAIVSEGASHVRIENLTIERFFGDAVRVAGGRDVVIDNSTIRWAGLHGASFVDAMDSGVNASDIHDTGEGGVLIAGGDRRTLTPARLFVRSSRIERFARIGYTFKPAVDIHGVGNIVQGNYIADAPNFGLMLAGNDHLIEGNELTRVVTDTTDSGAFYMGHDWTTRGTIIANNFLHDVKPGQSDFDVKGFYLDDFTSGITVRGNLFLRVMQPVFIGGGRDNLVEGNVFIAAEPAVHVDSRGLDWSSKFVVDPESELRKRLAAMPIDGPLWRQRYPQLPQLLADTPGDSRRNVSRGNVMIASRPYFLETKAQMRNQSFGPEFGAGKPVPLSAGAADAAVSARTAAEIGGLIGADLVKAGGPDLPYAAMDRAQVAGRRKGGSVR